MTDNIATLRGFTRYVLVDSDEISLHLLIRPDTDLDSTSAPGIPTSNNGSKSTVGCSRSRT
jgi:hypothetical protein